jgi:hypothetical protein
VPARLGLHFSVVPLKNEHGLTSTATDTPGYPWGIRRLTMHEALQLPETFTAADVPYRQEDATLLLNTGCWLMKLNEPWVKGLHFRQQDRIVKCLARSRGPPKASRRTGTSLGNSLVAAAAWGPPARSSSITSSGNTTTWKPGAIGAGRRVPARRVGNCRPEGRVSPPTGTRASRAMSFLTFFDAVDHVLDQVVGGNGSPRNVRQARKAVQEAVEELSLRRTWRYYQRPDLIQTQDEYDTGTIAYDATGGTYERMVTLTTGTWPSDAVDQALIVEGTRYGVDRRISDSVITLRVDDCPTQDIDAGTDYTLVKDSYLLPENVRKIDYLYDTLAPGRMIPMVSPDSIMRERRLTRLASYPLMYSVFAHERYHGRLAVHFAPSCGVSRQYAYMATIRAPIPTVYAGTANGTVAVVSGTASVTGTGSAFASSMEGCVLRTGDSSNSPTSSWGYTDNTFIAPVQEFILKTYSSATAFGLESAPTQSQSGVRYTISSLLDIAPTMRNAMFRLAEAKFSPQDRKGYTERLAEYERAYGIAAWGDQTMEETPGVGFMPTTLADLAATVGS